MRKYLFFITTALLLLLPFFDLNVEPVFAKVFECEPYVDCPEVNDPCPGGCDALSVSSICCQSLAGCYLQDWGTIPIWTWAHDPACTVTRVDINTGDYECKYKWTFAQCNAVDSCMTQPYLEAGLCASDGCKVGGDYKTCCQGATVVPCEPLGGQFSGTCPGGSIPTMGIGCTGATPAPTSPPADCPVNCSQWDGLGNAGTCWSNAGSGCKFCSDSETCVCGDCPVVPSDCPPGEFMCHNGGDCCRSSALYDETTCGCGGLSCGDDPGEFCCNVDMDNRCNDITDCNRGGLDDDACNNQYDPINRQLACCDSQMCPEARIHGYVTVNGGPQKAGPSVVTGCYQGSIKYCNSDTWHDHLNCPGSGNCNQGEACTVEPGTSSISVTAKNLDGTVINAGSPICKGTATTTDACWHCVQEDGCDPVCVGSPTLLSDWEIGGLYTYLPPTEFRDNLNLCQGKGFYNFTLNVPSGFMCNSWVINEGTSREVRGTGCTASNNVSGKELFQNSQYNLGNNNTLVFDISPAAEIKGQVYENPTTQSCGGNLVKRNVYFYETDINGLDQLKCTVSSDNGGVVGSYSSKDCPDNWAPKINGTYKVAVEKSTNEICTTASCSSSSCTATVSVPVSPAIRDFTIFPTKVAWFQSAFGDVHGNSTVGTYIPNTCSGTCSPYFSLGTASTAGVVSAGNALYGGIKDNSTLISIPQWNVDHESENLTDFGGKVYNYNHFASNLENCVNIGTSPSGKINPSTFNTVIDTHTFGCYNFIGLGFNSNNKIQISCTPGGACTKAVVLYNNDSLPDITIDNGIEIAPGAFFALVSKQNIIFGNSLGTDNKRIEGVYIADGSIKFSPSTYLAPDQFIGKGMFIANADLLGTDRIELNRGYADPTKNETSPSLTFEYRPDFLINFPVNFGFNQLSWQEIAP